MTGRHRVQHGPEVPLVGRHEELVMARDALADRGCVLAPEAIVDDRPVPDPRLLGAASALLGLGLGDETVAGIGQRRLATISPRERTTPAGRFVASLGNDYEQDILWVDYDSGLSLHRVINGHPKERRHQRLASPTPLDNRISYGCINVPVKFYDDLVISAFTGTVGIVYILPEDQAIEEVFAMGGNLPAATAQGSMQTSAAVSAADQSSTSPESRRVTNTVSPCTAISRHTK